jgi:hypothetical protein
MKRILVAAAAGLVGPLPTAAGAQTMEFNYEFTDPGASCNAFGAAGVNASRISP